MPEAFPMKQLISASIEAFNAMLEQNRQTFNIFDVVVIIFYCWWNVCSLSKDFFLLQADGQAKLCAC